MPRTLVRDLAAHVGDQVTVHGWINTLRLQRKIQFVLIRDHRHSSGDEQAHRTSV